jgi:hypothetical protein
MLPILSNKAHLSSCLAAKLRLDHVGSYQRFAESLAVARPGQHADDRVYMRAYLSIKRETLNAVTPFKLKSGCFRASDKLIAYLTTSAFVRVNEVQKARERLSAMGARIKTLTA